MDDFDLVARVTRWMDRWYDEPSGLLGYPSTAGSPTNPYQQAGVPVVRESAAYAVGLLARDEHSDRERAARVLECVLENQIDDPSSICHGTFRRAPHEPTPGDQPREWIDYDPNWREFIGSSLAVAIDRFEDRLPGTLVSHLERSLRLACEGTRVRDVPASYSNIALMCAFLLDWVGLRLDVGAWREAGERLAEEVAADYRRLGAFPEHNSPTYYGVDLYGLALWREVAPSEGIRRLGRELDAELWRDLTRFYHAGLRNLCGPYTRAYGMDMTRYVAALGAWMLPVVPDAAPLPALGDDVQHGHDSCELLWVGLLGTRPPEDVRAHIVEFQGERLVEQRVAESPSRVVTAWLGERAMLGGEHTSGRVIHWQQHPATLHWQLPDGDVGWLRLVANAPIDAVATEGRLEIEVHTGLRWLRQAEVSVWLEVSPAPESVRGSDDGAVAWVLPGIELWIRSWPGGPPQPGGAGDHGARRFGWRFGLGEAPDKLAIDLRVRVG